MQPKQFVQHLEQGFLTGCYPNRLGIHGAFMPNSNKGLNLAETTIAEMLKKVDYSTGIFGNGT